MTKLVGIERGQLAGPETGDVFVKGQIAVTMCSESSSWNFGTELSIRDLAYHVNPHKKSSSKSPRELSFLPNKTTTVYKITYYFDSIHSHC